MGKPHGPAPLMPQEHPSAGWCKAFAKNGDFVCQPTSLFHPLFKKSEFSIYSQVTMFDKTVCQNAFLSVMQFFDH